MTSPSVVRRAVPADKDELWRLLRLMHAESAMLSISDRKIDYHLNRFLYPESIQKDDAGIRGFIGVIGQIGALEGAIIITIGGLWYSDEMCLEEWLNSVDPQHRRSYHAKALIKYAIKIIDDMVSQYPNLKIVIGIVSTERTAAKIRLYRQYLEPAGCFFVYPKLRDTVTEPLERMYKEGRSARVSAHLAQPERNHREAMRRRAANGKQ